MNERLGKYKTKRDFSKTPEPGPDDRKSGASLLYGIQKHDATRLHYDLRLEHDGAMLSWAVPKGPSLDTHEKRLAVKVEDHPIDYMQFEGTIPKGNYGAGTVLVWDIGTWEPLGDVDKMLQEGALKFKIHGSRLRGAWTLVRIAKSKDDWLFIKERDQYVVPEDGEGAVIRSKTSILSPDISTKRLDPREFTPQLAELASRVPAGTEWIHEIKLDGYRMTAWKRDGKLVLQTRNKLDWTHKFRKIAQALEPLPNDTVVDGEIVVFNEKGITDFGGLQRWLKNGAGSEPVFVVFDLLEGAAKNLTNVPLLDRKFMLRSVMEEMPVESMEFLRYSDHAYRNAPALLKSACQQGLEGIISKRCDATYAQVRSSNWLKSKCTKQEEFVIGGFSAPKGTRTAIGALLIGQYDEEGQFVYSGRVGSGFDEKNLKEIYKSLKDLVQDDCPFAENEEIPSKDTTWVEPKVVAQVRYGERTQSGVLRHPVFLGIRLDKAAKDVTPESTPPPVLPIKLSNPDRIMFSDVGLTKIELANYYFEICDFMMPFIKDRPLALVRCPEGIDKPCFFQKHGAAGMSSSIVRNLEGEEVLTVNDVSELIQLVQFGVIEIHPWGSRMTEVEEPTVMVFDLDPSPDIEWPTVVEASLVVAEYLRAFGFVPFVKTTGGKGLHVVVPIIAGSADWNTFKLFTKGVVESLDKLVPGHFVTVMSKQKRKGRIFLDYLRNGRGSTSVGAYSVRSRPEAPVSVPVTWDAVRQLKSGAQFTVINRREWMPRKGSEPWREFYDSAKPLTDAHWDLLPVGKRP